jgi:hypothetical protein
MFHTPQQNGMIKQKSPLKTLFINAPSLNADLIVKD